MAEGDLSAREEVAVEVQVKDARPVRARRGASPREMSGGHRHASATRLGRDASRALVARVDEDGEGGRAERTGQRRAGRAGWRVRGMMEGGRDTRRAGSRVGGLRGGRA